VPVPPFLVADFGHHVADKSPDDLVFPGTRSASPLRAPVFRQAAFAGAAVIIDRPGLHPHELRHTAASPAIAPGADVGVD
jgi:integrase